MNNNKNENSLVLSYLELRKIIGILGIALPFVVSLGALIIFQTGLQSSISSYYHTGMRDEFVGALFAIGFFLYSYKGYQGDDKYGNLAFVFALGVALFPTTDPNGPVTNIDRIIAAVHVIFTAAFFATLIYFSYFLFTKSDQEELPKKKRQRNIVYRLCGILMGICLLGIVIDFILPSATAWLGDSLIFWLETIAILAFGVSWFVKGEAIALLNDEV